MHTIVKNGFLAAIIGLACGQIFAQQTLELRGAPDSRYRFADWSYTAKNDVIVDLFYVGVPGSNEFNLGGGYAWKPARSLMIAPLAYAVIGKEGGQRGIKIAALALFDKAGWKGNLFLGHFAPLHGSLSRYQVLDTGEMTHSVHEAWEAGISTGFFHTGGNWGPQIGPLVKRSDRLGAWSASYRFGTPREFRVARVFLLRK